MRVTGLVSANRGFSMVEMIVVLVIVSILAALILPRFRGSLAQRSVDEAARETHALMALGHQSAIAGGAISAVLPPPPVVGSSQLVAPLRMSLTNAPYTCVLMDGANFTDTAVSTVGRVVQSYTNSGNVAIAAVYQIPDARGVLGISSAVALPITLVFDTNGSLRRSPTNLTLLETLPAIPAGATLTMTFHVDHLMDHTLQMDSVSGLVTFQ